MMQGTLALPAGGEREVVLKRVRARVAGAQEMQEAELLLNVLASKAAREAVAPFVGFCHVEEPVRAPPWLSAGCLPGWLGAGCAVYEKVPRSLSERRPPV